MNFECLDRLLNFLSEKYKTNSDLKEIVFEVPPEGMKGDITVNCFRFAKSFKKNPEEIAEQTKAFFSSDEDVISVEKIKGFVNVELKPEAVHKKLIGKTQLLINSAMLPPEQRKKILIEYSAPNTNKPQHLGHVRNNTLGMALASLMKKIGHHVTPVNLINDRGIHICKSMLAYQRWGNGATPESSGEKGDHFVGKFYVKFDEELRSQMRILRESDVNLKSKSDEEMFLSTEIGCAAQKMLQDWEAGDPSVRSLWEKMNKWVIAGFEQTYRRMGVRFDHVYLESQTYLLGKNIIGKGLDKGVFTKTSDGAVIVDLEEFKLGKKVLLRSDGTSVYITQDIGTTVKKFEDINPDIQIWVVGDEQIHHFKLLSAILKKLGLPWAENLHHLAYGMVNLPSGKMKSREGTVVDADDLFDEMHDLAKSAILERTESQTPENIEKKAEIIGLGALKFMLLKFNPRTTIMFDPNASIKFEGDTGPYVQYACARINSIEKKAKQSNLIENDREINIAVLSTKEEKDLSVCALKYPRVLREAAEKMDSSGLVDYLLELAKAFSRFYRECSVLSAENPDLKNARFQLCMAVRDILSDGLKTLTIDVPDSM